MKRDIALLILRLSGFVLAFAHGWQKVAMLAAGKGGAFVSAVEGLGFPIPVVFAWAAALAEFAGGLAVGFGLWTRIAASFTGFTMFVAAFFRHHLPGHLLVWLGVNHSSEAVVESWGNPERAVSYLLIFTALVLMGGGRFSLDRALRRARH